MVAANVTLNALDSFGTKSPSKNDPMAALRAAGALYDLEKKSLSEFSGQPANDDLHVVVRTDTGQAIGAVGNTYECFPNEQFFVPTAQALVDTGAEITRFQLIDGGTRAFMRFRWNDDANLRIGGPKVGDIVGRRATLSTSHDGKWAGKFTVMMLRLACSNGMTVPVGTFDVSLTHTVGGLTKLKDLQILAPTIETYVRQFEAAAGILAETKIRPADDLCDEIIRKMVDRNNKAGEKRDGGPNQGQLRINRIRDLFAGAQPEADNRAMKDTGWGLYQAGVHLFTHEMTTRGEDKAAQRFKSQLPGGPANREIVKAWSVVTEGLGVDEQIAAAVS
jgi:hypothetical protein